MERKYLLRQSLFSIVNSRNDKGRQLGYDYTDTLFEKSVSSYFYGEKKRVAIIKKIETLYVFLIDSVKNIKKTYFIAVNKNSRNLN